MMLMMITAKKLDKTSRERFISLSHVLFAKKEGDGDEDGVCRIRTDGE